MLKTKVMTLQEVFSQAFAYQQSGKFDQAEYLYKKLITARPELPEPCNNLATLFKNKGDLEASEHWVNQALLLKPDYPDALNNLGGCPKTST